MIPPTGTKQSRWANLLLIAVSLLVVAPLLRNGTSCGHDLDFHLLNWLEAAQQFRHGILRPVWAATPAWNAGEPRFVFYPPLSWSIGGLLTLLSMAGARLLRLSGGHAFALVPAAYTLLALLWGGAAVFRLARRWAGETAALVSAVLYMCSPYALFTAYERTAFGEILSMALLPVLVAEALAGLWPTPVGTLATSGQTAVRPSVPAIALAIALLWLSDAPAAMMGCYAFLGLTTVRLAAMYAGAEPQTYGFSLFGRWMAGTLLGFGIASFFLVPALAEKRWVQLGMAVITGMRPADNTLFHHTGDPEHDAVLHTASLIALWLGIALLAAVAVAFLRERPRTAKFAGAERPPRHSQPWPLAVMLLAGCGGTVFFLQTPPSLPLWRFVPELVFLQFPWRFLAVLSAVVALLCAWALRGLRLRAARQAMLLLVLSILLTLPTYRTLHQSCDVEDTPVARFAQVLAPDPAERGSEPTDEYTPASADNDALATSNPPFWLLFSGAPDDAPAPDLHHGGPAPSVLQLHLEHPARIVFNLRDYPAWSVARNGHLVPDRIARQDGLLTVPLPQGDSDLRIQWRTTTAARVGAYISIGSLVLLIAVWRHERRQA